MSNPQPPEPASSTKHHSILHHTIPFASTTLALRQISSSTSGESTGTTGSTLWLSAQLLSLYLLSLPFKKGTVLDLGSGIGYLPLCLRSKGYEVIATDIPEVIESVLRDNIINGLDTMSSPDGGIEVSALDWENVYATVQLPDSLTGRKIDMITTSDTLYAPHLLQPLLTTLQVLSDAQKAPPTIYVGLERRDPGLIEKTLDEARSMGLNLNRIDKGRIDRLMAEAGWNGEEWDDVEIWKGKFGRRRT
jgi:predicted nicotinamide N-methyase